MSAGQLLIPEANSRGEFVFQQEKAKILRKSQQNSGERRQLPRVVQLSPYVDIFTNLVLILEIVVCVLNLAGYWVAELSEMNQCRYQGSRLT